MPARNDFLLTSRLIESIEYLTGSLLVTAGKPAAKYPTFTRDDATWTMTLLADRSNNRRVANFFNKNAGGSEHEFPTSGGDIEPSALNFFFGVIVTFRIGSHSIPVTLYIGQGHRLLGNNWWVGGGAVSASFNVFGRNKTLLLIREGNEVVRALTFGAYSENHVGLRAPEDN